MALLNLENVPNNEISGLSTELLEWVTEQSMDRNVIEIGKSFTDMLNDFQNSEDITPDIIIELDKLEKENVPASSAKHMTVYTDKFRQFLVSRKLNPDLQNLPVPILNNYLRYFYSELRQTNGQYYSPASLICIRAGIHRYLCLHRPEVNIITDRQFDQSNRMLKTMVAKFKKSGQSKGREYSAIEPTDMNKIRLHFDRSNPEVLQQEVIFNLIYFLGLRGRETLPYLTKSSIIEETSSTGTKFLRLSHDLLSKNAKASLKPKEYEDIKKARIYENKEKPEECPIVAWHLYTAKIADSPHLFPKPSKVTHRLSNVWYTNKMSLGKNTIDNLMSNISGSLNLSRRYTNHCLRVTLVTVLKEQGYSNSDICEVTGHKNPGSVDRYSRKRRDADRESISYAAQQGASSSLISVSKVSKKSHVLVTMEKSNLCADSTAPTVFNINFNGSFCNTVINVNKE